MGLDEAAAWYAWYKRVGRRGLRKVLFREWDVLGVAGGPEFDDEYDTYLGLVAAQLRRGATQHGLATLLGSIRTERMDLPADADTDDAAARALLAWYSEHGPVQADSDRR